MKKVLSITLSLIIIVTACLGFGTVALANNYSSAQAIQEELNKNKFNSSTPLTVTVTGTYNLSERLVIYSNSTFNLSLIHILLNDVVSPTFRQKIIRAN